MHSHGCLYATGYGGASDIPFSNEVTFHCFTKWPNLRQFIQRLWVFSIETILSSDKDLNLPEAYLSVLHRTQRLAAESVVLAANDVVVLQAVAPLFGWVILIARISPLLRSGCFRGLSLEIDELQEFGIVWYVC